MEARAPQASIELFAGQTLEFVAVGDAWFELRGSGAVVARLRSPRSGLPARADAADGSWWIVNRRGSELDAGRQGSDQTIARYRPGVLGGGRITIEGAGRYFLRPPVLGSATRLRRGVRTIAGITDVREVSLADGATEPALSLLVLVALQALLVEMLMPHVAGGGGA